MKRIICLIVIILLLINGCSKLSEQQNNEVPPETIVTNHTYDEHLTISIGFWDIQDMVNNKQQDDVLAYIESMFNITIEPIPVNWSDYKERYQILNATGSLPDVFANVTISLENLILSKSIRSLPKDLSAYPNIIELLEKCGHIQSDDGKYYIIPRSSFQDPVLGASDATMIVRKDWMQQLGLSQPESLNEFIDLVCAFSNQDPDGNGMADTIGYNINNRIALGKWVMLGIAPECNVYSWVHNEAEYIPSYLTEDFKKVILAYRTLYERGGLDPNFYTKKSSDAIIDFVSGKLGALEFKSSPSSIMELKSQWDMYQEKRFEDCVDIIHIFPTDEGEYYCNTSSIFWSESLFSADVDDKKMERILSLFDYLLSNEGLNLIKYGLEGSDYMNNNGEFTCLLETKGISLIKVLQKKYPSLLLFNSLASWGGTWDDFDDNEINSLRYGDYAMDLASKELKWNVEHAIPVERPFDFILMPKESTEYFNTESVIDDFTRVIIGDEDPLTMWDSIIDGYYKKGLTDYIKRQNQLFQEKYED